MNEEEKQALNLLREMNTDDFLRLVTFFKTANIDYVISNLNTTRNLKKDITEDEKQQLSKEIQIIQSLNAAINK